ncbi:carboxylating nicotinate-nucleotide diphosphorylase [bacterium]|nr:carboxylating nicotinate-nucleotide diphosphorylase [bacterium]
MTHAILEWPEVASLLDAALAEDIGSGDLTSQALMPPGTQAHGAFRAKEAGTLAGLPLIAAVYERVDPAVTVALLRADGDDVEPGDAIATVAGPAIAVLSGERVVLNFLQRLSGIATITRRYVRLAAPHGAKVLDTRKTTPGWRRLEKYAVAAAGGTNHRMGLYDQALIKDNHLRLAEQQWPGRAVAGAVEAARAKSPAGALVEVEADTLEQVRDAIAAGADIVLLDNMTDVQMRAAVTLAHPADPRPVLEASGGITEERIESVARTGVDWISVGAITHSAPALDIGLDFDPPG